MTVVLEVALGMALLLTAFSLVCSAAGEFIATVIALRSKTLWRGVNTLVGSLDAAIQRNPLVHSPDTGGKVPDISYLPTRTFVLCLLDEVGRAAKAFPQTAAALSAGIDGLPADERVKLALHALVDEAGADLERAKSNLGAWFDRHMERVTGWYKRRMQLVLFLVGLVAAPVFGVDAIHAAGRMWKDPAVREAMVRSAEAAVKARPEPTTGTGTGTGTAEGGQAVEEAVQAAVRAVEKLESLGAPTIPWARYRSLAPADPLRNEPGMLDWLRDHGLGFLLTAFAASLGAPFWFDLLGKLVNLRSAGRKPDPAPRAAGGGTP